MPRFSNRPFLATTLSLLSSRAKRADLWCAIRVPRSYRPTTSTITTESSWKHQPPLCHSGFPGVPRNRRSLHGTPGQVGLLPRHAGAGGMTRKGQRFIKSGCGSEAFCKSNLDNSSVQQPPFPCNDPLLFVIPSEASGSAVRPSCAPLLPVHNLHQSPNPHGNTNLPFVIPGFQE
jgi:hypothetical protein